MWIDSLDVGDRTKRILTNLNNIINLRQEDLLPFAKGLASGFFQDGMWGSVTGVWDLGKFGTRVLIQSSLPAALIYQHLFGEQPLAPEYRAAKKAADQLANLARRSSSSPVN